MVEVGESGLYVILCLFDLSRELSVLMLKQTSSQSLRDSLTVQLPVGR